MLVEALPSESGRLTPLGTQAHGLWRIIDADDQSWSGCPAGSLIEEKRLAYRHTQGFRLVRLGDQECGFRLLAGQKLLWICRDEDHRYLERSEQIIDRVQPGAPVRQLNVGQH